MKKSFLIIVVSAFVGLSGFTSVPADYEQITFDYFVAEILQTDFPDVTSFEFKGKTEESFSALGKYKFCLKPKEKLEAFMETITKAKNNSNVKEIKFSNINGLKISDFERKSNGCRLFLYPSVHVAGNYYVFLSFQMVKEKSFRYVFELNPEGDILRSCKMD